MSNSSVAIDPWLSGFDRTATAQAALSLEQALRVLALLPQSESCLTPHPLIVVRSEIDNARRFLSLVASANAVGEDGAVKANAGSQKARGRRYAGFAGQSAKAL